jgi:hypothetical protein
MATMMALMNRRIVRIEPLDLFPELTQAYDLPDAQRPRVLMRAVRIDFANPSTPGMQQLYYATLDATDKALEFYPEFLDWAGQHKPSTVLIKSASYLLHDPQFSKIRDMLLGTADVVVQDDTGIPYHFISQSPWHVKLYGRYNRPIRPLSYGYQKDLEQRMARSKNRRHCHFLSDIIGAGTNPVLSLRTANKAVPCRGGCLSAWQC